MASCDEKFPQFFKVFLPEHCSKNLKIPDAFLSRISKKMLKKAVLRSQFGELWPVELAETEDGVFFQGGWSRLVVDNSLLPGDFLVFKYNGLDVFDIKILEATGCEKEQVCSIERKEKSMMADEGDDRQQEEQELERKIRQQSSVSKGEEIGRSARYEKLGGRGENNSFSGYHPRNLERGINPMQLQLNNPFFVTKINRCSGNKLAIPHDIRADFGLKFKEKILLQDPKRRSWEGNVVRWRDGRVVIKDAWKKLCQWNKISDDDTLVCEIMPSSKRICQVIKVHIC